MCLFVCVCVCASLCACLCVSVCVCMRVYVCETLWVCLCIYVLGVWASFKITFYPSTNCTITDNKLQNYIKSSCFYLLQREKWRAAGFCLLTLVSLGGRVQPFCRKHALARPSPATPGNAARGHSATCRYKATLCLLHQDMWRCVT